MRKCRCGHLEVSHRHRVTAIYQEYVECSKCDCERFMPKIKHKFAKKKR